MGRSAWAASVASVGVALALVAQGVGSDFGYNSFGDRDLARGALFLTSPSWRGPELSGGGGAQLPGGYVALAYGLPQWLGVPPARGAYAVTMAGAALAVLSLQRSFASRGAPWAGVWAGGVFATTAAWMSVVRDLWNPGLLALPMAIATVAAVRVAEGDARWLRWWALSVAVATQAHLSALVWAACTGVALAWTGRAGGRAWAGAGLWFAAPFLPYMVEELATGGENTLRMMDQHLGEGGAMWSAARASEAVGWLLTAPEELVDPSHPVATGAAQAAGVCVGLLALRGVWVGGRAGRVLGVGVAGSVVLLGVSALPYLAARYVAVLAAPTAALAALGLSGGGRAWWVVAALAMAARAPALIPRAVSGDPKGHAVVMATLAEVRARTGWTDAELVARTTWRAVQRADEPEDGLVWPAVRHLVADAAPATEGECALLLRVEGRPPREVQAELLRRQLRLAGPLDLRSVDPLSTPWTLVRYRAPGQACPSSMSQRYVPAGPEAELHRAWGRRACGEVWALEAGGIGAVLDARFDGSRCVPLVVALEARHGAARPEVWLHSNQLRGLVDNGGWYGAVMLEDVTLRVQGPAGEVAVPLAAGRVGGWYAAAPLKAPHPGPGEATLTARVVSLGPREAPEEARTRDVVWPLGPLPAP